MNQISAQTKNKYLMLQKYIQPFKHTYSFNQTLTNLNWLFQNVNFIDKQIIIDSLYE